MDRTNPIQVPFVHVILAAIVFSTTTTSLAGVIYADANRSRSGGIILADANRSRSGGVIYADANRSRAIQNSEALNSRGAQVTSQKKRIHLNQHFTKAPNRSVK